MKIVCALYPDPETGYPPVYARDTIPTITGYPGQDGKTQIQSAPTPNGVDFIPGELLGCKRCVCVLVWLMVAFMCVYARHSFLASSKETTVHTHRTYSGELGLRKFLEDRGHTYVVTTDKDGEVTKSTTSINL